jgi:PTS hybrid protein
MTAALEAACEVAEQAAQSTITMQARKGRASYLGNAVLVIRIRAPHQRCLWCKCWLLRLTRNTEDKAMVNLVIVSHSAQLGQGVGELARQMLRGDSCKLAIAAGIDDPTNPIGTDPIKVMDAILSVADTDAILVLMDMGSALLSAETALDLLEPEVAARVHLCPAPLVEGALAATVSAASGASIDKVIEDAQSALQAKRVQLGFPALEESRNSLSSAEIDACDAQAESVTVEINNPNGLHVRPAARLVEGFPGLMRYTVGKRGQMRQT